MKILSLYNEGKTTQQIADLVGISRKTISKRLNSIGIKSRERHHNGYFEGVAKRKEIFKEKNKERNIQILELYNNGNTIVQISNSMKVPRCSIGKILSSLGITKEERRKQGLKNGNINQINKLKIRNKQENEKILELYNNGFLIKNISKETGLDIDVLTKRLNKLGIDQKERFLRGSKAGAKTRTRSDILDDEIKDLYLNKRMSTVQIGKKFNCSSTLILERLRQLNIERRETPIGECGDKNPAWLGGISFEPYGLEFNKAFKLFIKERDNFTCLKCGLFEFDARKLFNKGLCVHHIDYIKENTLKENCCALCVRCHAETGTNRSSWTKFFQSLLNQRYAYKYTEDGKIIINIGENNEK